MTYEIKETSFKLSPAHMRKVFLGGTCAESTWRDDLVNGLTIQYFNPVVDDWTPDCQQHEIKQREICDYILYAITPRMKGVYSIAEVVEDACTRPEKTIFAILNDYEPNLEFTKGELKSLDAVVDMVERHGVHTFRTLHDIRDYLNSRQ